MSNENKIIKDESLFKTILDLLGLDYEIKDRKIVLINEDGDYFSTHDGEIIYFENPTDAINSLDWMFENE